MTISVSVAMCTFNGGQYLGAQLDSILGQSQLPDEIVIVDDGSTDATISVLREYQLRYPLIRLEYNESNLGPIRNFEKAARLCRGNLIFFSDQDDLWHPQKIARMTSALGDGDFLYSDAEVIDSDGRLIEVSELSFHRVKPCPERDPWYFFWNNCVSGHNLMVTRSLLERSYPFPQTAMYDQWLALLASAGSGIRFLPQALCRHRIHASNFTNNLKRNPTKQHLSKSRGFSFAARKSRLYQRHRFHREMVERLRQAAPDSLPNAHLFKLFRQHLADFDRTIFNVPLFIEFCKAKDEMLDQDPMRLKLKKFRKFCLGGRGYLFPFV